MSYYWVRAVQSLSTVIDNGLHASLFVNRLPEEAREEECDKDMRKLVYLLGLLFFMACGEDAKEGIIPEPDVPYDYSEFGGYHVKDTVG